MIFKRTTRLLNIPCLYKYLNNQSSPLIIKSGAMSPNVHLSMEQFLIKQVTQPCLFTRTNTTPGSIVVGKNQLAQAECDLKKMERDGVELVRRGSGGGAVYVDGGNSMIGILGPNSSINKQVAHTITVQAVNQTFNLSSRFTGKNDIKVDEYKVAGFAYANTKGKFLAHACISVDTDLTMLAKYLTPHQKVLESKGTKSVDQQVRNLVKLSNKNYHQGLSSVDSLNNSVIEVFSRHFPNADQIELTHEMILTIPDVMTNYRRLTSPDYLAAKHIEYNLDLAHKFSWGFVRLFLKIKENVIEEIEISTSCLEIDLIERLKQHWKGKGLEDFAYKGIYKTDGGYHEMTYFGKDYNYEIIENIYDLVSENLTSTKFDSSKLVMKAI